MDVDKQRLLIAQALSSKLKIPVHKLIELQKMQAAFICEGMKNMQEIKVVYLGTFRPSDYKIKRRDERIRKREERERNKQIPSSQD